MVSNLKKYFNIIEPWTEERDVGSYLFDNSIKYDIKVVTARKLDIAWIPPKPEHICIYTTRLTGEEVLILKLTFPNLIITEPVIEEKGK